MPTKKTYRATTAWLYDMALNDIDVVCPRCAGHAIVTTTAESSGWSAPRRLTCPSCAYTDAWPDARQRSTVWGGAVDPYFRRPLWLRTRWRGHTVWAFNRRHLTVLESFVEASIRQRSGGPDTMVARLPRWMKSAKNRTALLGALRRLGDASARSAVSGG